MHGKEKSQVFVFNINNSIRLVSKHVPGKFKFHRRKQKGHSKILKAPLKKLTIAKTKMIKIKQEILLVHDNSKNMTRKDGCISFGEM